MDFADFFSQLFSDTSSLDSTRILMILVGGFLVGLISGLLFGRTFGIKWKRIAKKDKASADELQTRYASLNEEYELQRADLQRASNELEEEKKNNAELKKENAQLAKELTSANNKLEHMDARITADSALMDDLRHQILGLKTRIKELSGGGAVETDDTADTLSSFQERLKTVEEKIPEIEKFIQNLQNSRIE